jgi:hypothetical protein
MDLDADVRHLDRKKYLDLLLWAAAEVLVPFGVSYQDMKIEFGLSKARRKDLTGI